MDKDYCWHHGYEPIPDDVYRLCGECGHAWRKDELIAAYTELTESWAEEGLTVPLEPVDPETIFACPLCAHDF